MVGFQTGAAHGDERIGRLAVEAAIFEIGRVVGRRRVLTVDAFPCQLSPRVQDLVLRRMNEANAVLLRKGQNFFAAHRLADGDALGDGRRGRDGLRLRLALFCRAEQRVAIFALEGDNLREMVDGAAALEMLERVDCTEEERAVAGGDNDMGRDTAQLLEGRACRGRRCRLRRGRGSCRSSWDSSPPGRKSKNHIFFQFLRQFFVLQVEDYILILLSFHYEKQEFENRFLLSKLNCK